MMRTLTRLIAVCGIAAAVITSRGCRNPFNPSTDIYIREIVATNQWTNNMQFPEMGVYDNHVNAPPYVYSNWQVTTRFVIRNKVGVNISRVNIVYTNYHGDPVTGYGATGREFLFMIRLDPYDPGFGGFGTNETAVTLFLIDETVLSELLSPSYPSDHIMIATMTFIGEDDNGYDVKLSGKITIKGYF